MNLLLPKFLNKRTEPHFETKKQIVHDKQCIKAEACFPSGSYVCIIFKKNWQGRFQPLLLSHQYILQSTCQYYLTGYHEPILFIFVKGFYPMLHFSIRYIFLETSERVCIWLMHFAPISFMLSYCILLKNYFYQPLIIKSNSLKISILLLKDH